jgi:very-short-patch-repair endonuclease
MHRDLARHLRRNMTDAEKHLWRLLRCRQLDGHKFRRQAPVGHYILDFVCYSAKLVIELDGGQHAEQAEEDARRTAWLASQGFRVLRFWNNEVFENSAGILEVVCRALQATPDPLPQNG